MINKNLLTFKRILKYYFDIIDIDIQFFQNYYY